MLSIKTKPVKNEKANEDNEIKSTEPVDLKSLIGSVALCHSKSREAAALSRSVNEH